MAKVAKVRAKATRAKTRALQSGERAPTARAKVFQLLTSGQDGLLKFHNGPVPNLVPLKQRHLLGSQPHGLQPHGRACLLHGRHLLHHGQERQRRHRGQEQRHRHLASLRRQVRETWQEDFIV